MADQITATQARMLADSARIMQSNAVIDSMNKAIQTAIKKGDKNTWVNCRHDSPIVIEYFENLGFKVKYNPYLKRMYVFFNEEPKKAPPLEKSIMYSDAIMFAIIGILVASFLTALICMYG